MSSKIEQEEKQQKVVADLVNKLDTSKFVVHTMSVDESIKHLKTDVKKGLSTDEAAKRLEKHGPNELEGEEDKSLWERIAEQFEDELVIILLVAAVISFIIALTGNLKLNKAFAGKTLY